jgi:type I restriction enzyme S subunit
MSEDATLDDFVEKEPESVDGFKETAAGRIPSDWDTENVEMLCELRNGKATNHTDIGESEYLVYGSNGPIGSHSESNFDEGLIFGRVGAVGEVERVRQPVWVSDNAIQATVNKGCNTDFLYYFLSNKELSSLATKTAQPLLNQSTIGNVTVPTPPLSEQHKIATVLYTVDQAIQKTEEIIEQSETAKQSLMQALFLDGYYEHDGTVEAHHRNRLHRHPSRWTTKPAEEVMNVTRGAHPRPKSDDSLWGGDIPIIKISDRNRGDSRTITSTDDMVTEKGSQSSKLVDEGTLIVSNAGTVGAARITGMQTCIHDHWLILRDYEEHLTTRYLYYFINWNQNFLEALASGSTVLDLNTDDFRLFDVTFPTLDEQQEITDALDSLHEQKMVNIQYADRLRRVKQGLMQDLLSGTIRTTDTNIEVPDEIAQHG